MTKGPRRWAAVLLALALLPAPPAAAAGHVRPVPPQKAAVRPAGALVPRIPAGSGATPSLGLPAPAPPPAPPSPTAVEAAGGPTVPRLIPVAQQAQDVPAVKSDGQAGPAKPPKVGDERFQEALASFQEAAEEASGGNSSGQANLQAGFDGTAAAARTEAANAALDALGRGLATRGYGAMPAAPIMPPDLPEELKTAYDAWAERSPERAGLQLLLYDEGSVRWGETPGISPSAAGSLRSLMESLVSGLDRRLPGENLFVGAVELRFVKNELPIGGFLHLDQGDYLTMTLELYPGAPGTTLYEIVDGALLITETTPGQAAVLSGSMREFSTGIPATGHTGPRTPVARRITVVAHLFSRSGGFPDDMEDILARERARLAAIEAALRTAPR